MILLCGFWQTHLLGSLCNSCSCLEYLERGCCRGIELGETASPSQVCRPLVVALSQPATLTGIRYTHQTGLVRLVRPGLDGEAGPAEGLGDVVTGEVGGGGHADYTVVTAASRSE